MPGLDYYRLVRGLRDFNMAGPLKIKKGKRKIQQVVFSSEIDRSHNYRFGKSKVAVK